jgi:hypothetical protein
MREASDSPRTAHDLQEVQARILLGLHGQLDRARNVVVQLQSVRLLPCPYVWHRDKPHSYEEKGDANKDAQSKSRASLERYLFYHSRYANHEQSAKLEGELYKRIEKKMDELQTVSSTLSWIEVRRPG